jgi:hypothetical protein
VWHSHDEHITSRQHGCFCCRDSRGGIGLGRRVRDRIGSGLGQRIGRRFGIRRSESCGQRCRWRRHGTRRPR